MSQSKSYARVVNGVVFEVVSQEALDTFNPTVRAWFTECPAGTQQLMVTADGGRTFSAPPAPSPAPAP